MQCRIQQFFGGAGFSVCIKEKNRCTAEKSGRLSKLSLVGFRGKAPENFGYFTFWIAQNRKAHCETRAWTVICLFLDELVFTLLRV